MAAASDPWRPSVYEQFADERSRPFHDLLALVERTTCRRAVDLGCGTGALTARAFAVLEPEVMVGVDASRAMLAEAAQHRVKGRLSFVQDEISSWTSSHDHDVVLANASLHWVPDHRRVLGRWTAALAPGGQLAVQVPSNADHPAHVLAGEVARSASFRSAFEGEPPADPVVTNVLRPEDYARLLDELGYEQQHVRLQIYAHRLVNTDAVVDWLRGSTLTRFERAMPSAMFDDFVTTLRGRVVEELGESSPFFYPFKRILIWGRLPR
jgi:trans-aconitate 2-methyltransferase